MSKVVSTHLWNTPLNLYQQAISAGIPFIIGVAGGLPIGCARARGVARNFLGKRYPKVPPHVPGSKLPLFPSNRG